MRPAVALLALAMVGPAVPAPAQEAQGPPEDLLKRRAVYSVPGIDRVRVRRDLAYRQTEPVLEMDVYLPNGIAFLRDNLAP
jgi:hypothetical protein